MSKKGGKGVRRSTTGGNQRLIGTAGNDILNASEGKGNNFLKGSKGNDLLFAGTRDQLFGDAGNDLLDACKGRGGNSLNGGSGNDVIWAGQGSDRLTGGQGADQFWIASRKFPARANTIEDFKPEDAIGVSKLAGVSSFADLTLKQQGKNTMIKAKGKPIAVLLGVARSSLASSNFVGLQPLPTLSISNSGVSERDTGVTSGTVQVTLNSRSKSPVTVDYRTVAGTATPEDNDYTPTSGTLTFAPGETSKTIAVNVINDTRNEFDETLSVVLGNPKNSVIINSQAQLSIIDNDVTVVKGIGVQSDGGGTSDVSIRYQYNLYNISSAGIYRADENSDNYAGKFSGALENFTGGVSEFVSLGSRNQFLKFDSLRACPKITSHFFRRSSSWLDDVIPERMNPASNKM